MAVALESVDGNMQRIMYFVKRPTYELAFVVPETLHAARKEQACCHVRLKTTYRTGAFVLDAKNLAHFYEDLSGMMEYIRNERAKLQGPVPQR